MLAVLATCARLRDESDVDFVLVRPRDAQLRRLFANTNWAHLATPLRFAESAICRQVREVEARKPDDDVPGYSR